MPLTPNNRQEHWMQEIIDAIGNGGGGGSSDLSIANVTVTNNTGSGLVLNAPLAFDANEAWDEAPACAYTSVTLESGDNSLKVVMYKGKAFIDNTFGKATIVVTGGIELVYDDFMFQITGDGTITIS